ncbi:hypothetical protein QE152_g12396 [Popillia japonica]|uniref:Uncharacterized protein n=1 Tax=Popillia japonica TaxID=7064 RepID=A0AAW1LKA1_POPJA
MYHNKKYWVFRALESTQTLKAITICITTRSIGFSATTMIRALYSFNNVPVRGSIYQIYRVYLAMLECKLTLDSRKATAITGDYNYYQELRRSETFVGIVRACNYVPDMLTRMINAVGTVKTDGKIYVPKLAAIRTAVNDPELVIPEQSPVRVYFSGPINYDNDGSRAQLGCNNMGGLRISDRRAGEAELDYYQRIKLEGNVTEFENGEAELDYYQRIKLEGNVTEFENLVTGSKSWRSRA